MEAVFGNTAEKLPSEFDKLYKLGKIKIVPGNFIFFGINICQNVDLTIETDIDVKI